MAPSVGEIEKLLDGLAEHGRPGTPLAVLWLDNVSFEFEVCYLHKSTRYHMASAICAASRKLTEPRKGQIIRVDLRKGKS